MICDNGLGDGGHSAGVAAQSLKRSYFGGRLICRAGSVAIYSLFKRYSEPRSRLFGDKRRLLRIGLTHGRKTRNETLVVFAEKRVLAEKRKMVGDEHKVAGDKIGVYSSCGVGQNKIFYAEQKHNPDIQRYVLHVIALIAVKPSLHCENIFATLFGGAKNAGVILGAKVPIVLVSRSDSAYSKLASIAAGSVLSRRMHLS